LNASSTIFDNRRDLDAYNGGIERFQAIARRQTALQQSRQASARQQVEAMGKLLD